MADFSSKKVEFFGVDIKDGKIEDKPQLENAPSLGDAVLTGGTIVVRSNDPEVFKNCLLDNVEILSFQRSDLTLENGNEEDGDQIDFLPNSEEDFEYTETEFSPEYEFKELEEVEGGWKEIDPEQAERMREKALMQAALSRHGFDDRMLDSEIMAAAYDVEELNLFAINLRKDPGSLGPQFIKEYGDLPMSELIQRTANNHDLWRYVQVRFNPETIEQALKVISDGKLERDLIENAIKNGWCTGPMTYHAVSVGYPESEIQELLKSEWEKSVGKDLAQLLDKVRSVGQ